MNEDSPQNESNILDDGLRYIERQIAEYDRFKWRLLTWLLLIPLLTLSASAVIDFSIESFTDQSSSIINDALEQLQQSHNHNISVTVFLTTLETPTPTPGTPIAPTIREVEVTREVEVIQEIEVTRIVTQVVTIERTVPVTITLKPEFVEVTRLYIIPPATPSTIGEACTRFDFELGREKTRGSRGSGWYVVEEVTGRIVTGWYAEDGLLDSGWLEHLSLSADEVNVFVKFYPDAGGQPIDMEILNGSSDLKTGWLRNNVCHAIELQFPINYNPEN